MEERLQKIMARAGIGSRRACEKLIEEGRVRVNGKIATLGQKADPLRDRITFDGDPVRITPGQIYVALYKPPGVLSAVKDEPGGYPTVRDLVDLPGHLFPVGRLDLLSEGLILLTDDGELTNLLTHPRYEHDKEYQVRVAGNPSESNLEKWRQGVELDDGPTAPAEVSVLRREISGTWLQIVMHEGRKRQIRRVAEMLGHPVRQLIRVRVGPIELGALRRGEWRYLTEQEIAQLDRLKRDLER